MIVLQTAQRIGYLAVESSSALAWATNTDNSLLTYTELVPLKYGKFATKYRKYTDIFYSLWFVWRFDCLLDNTSLRRVFRSVTSSENDGTLIANSHRQTRRNSTVGLRRVGRYELARIRGVTHCVFSSRASNKRYVRVRLTYRLQCGPGLLYIPPIYTDISVYGTDSVKIWKTCLGYIIHIFV